MKYVWPPILAAMAGAREKIADGLAAADRASHDLELAQEKAVERLKEAKEEAAGIVDSANKRANQIVEEAKDAAVAEGDRLKEAAQAEIEQELNRAREQLRSQVAALALAGARRSWRRRSTCSATASWSTSWPQSCNGAQRLMAELSTLARPYARAAFEYAREQGDLANWSDATGTAAAVTADADHGGPVLADPALTAEQQARHPDRGLRRQRSTATVPTSSGAGRQQAPGRCCRRSAELFEQYKANQEKSVDVEVVHSAFELDETEQKLARAEAGKLERAK